MKPTDESRLHSQPGFNADSGRSWRSLSALLWRARSKGDDGEPLAVPLGPSPIQEFGGAMCCGGYRVFLQISPDLHSPLEELWPGTFFGTPVPPPNIEGRFDTSARRVVQVLLSRPDLAVEIDIQENGKGCDIGYALVVSSREGANNVDARTVTAS